MQRITQHQRRRLMHSAKSACKKRNSNHRVTAVAMLKQAILALVVVAFTLLSMSSASLASNVATPDLGLKSLQQLQQVCSKIEQAKSASQSKIPNNAFPESLDAYAISTDFAAACIQHDCKNNAKALPTGSVPLSKVDGNNDVTILKDKIYVLNKDTFKITVYSSLDYKKLYEIVYPKTEDMTAEYFGSCEKNNNLYFTFLIETDSSHSFAKTARKEIGSGVSSYDWNIWMYQPELIISLSVTPTCGVVVITERGLLRLYNEDKRQVGSDIQLSYVSYALQAASGNFFVSVHNRKTESSSVAMLNSTGQVLHSYGGPSGSGEQSLDRPVQLAIDDCGRIIVSDLGNKRVVMIDSSLKNGKILLSDTSRSIGMSYSNKIGTLVTTPLDQNAKVYIIM